MNWLDTLTGYAQDGADIYATVKGNDRAATNPAPAVTPTTTPAWLWPVVIGGAILVLALGFLGARK